MVVSRCKKEDFLPIQEVGEKAWIVRFSKETEYVPEVDEHGEPTGEMIDSGWVIFTEEMVYGELDVNHIRWIRLQELAEYDASPAVNEFYVDDIPMWYNNMERVSIDYLLHVEKSQGSETTDLYDKNGNKFTINIDLVIALIAQVELYAKAAYDVTIQHKAALNALDDIDELLAYDIKAGYPEKLHLSTELSA